jgi:hypothetical protein
VQIEGSVEQQLREMAEAGELSGLPGEGHPFPREDDANAAERWAASRLVRKQRLLPAWLELRREIQTERDRLIRVARAHLRWIRARSDYLRRIPAERILDAARATSARERATMEELAAALQELNRAIARHNSVVPAAALALMPERLEGVLARAGAGADQAARSPRDRQTGGGTGPKRR